MGKAEQPDLELEAAGAAAEDGEGLIVDIDGYEGPLHVLLALARSQKVDLLKLSVLVMAAWLAYLKSRLILPKPDKGDGAEPPAEEVAAALAFRLARLDAIRKAAEGLMARPQLQRDVHMRGDPDAVKIVSTTRFEGDLYGLVQAYIGQVRKDAARRYRPATPPVLSLDDARARLRGELPRLKAWKGLHEIAPDGENDGPSRASCVASTLSAGLELVKEGALEAKQMQHFAEVYLRARRLEAAE